MVKEAYRFAIPPIAIGVICIFFGWKWPAGIFIFLGLFVFYFFRDPERVIPSDPGVVVSPADGRVVEIVDEPLDSVMGHRISIFLSIWNVHVQRAPVAGPLPMSSTGPANSWAHSAPRPLAKTSKTSSISIRYKAQWFSNKSPEPSRAACYAGKARVKRSL